MGMSCVNVRHHLIRGGIPCRTSGSSGVDLSASSMRLSSSTSSLQRDAHLYVLDLL